MKENKVSQWEGELVWKEEPRTGKSKKGKDWSSIDFVLKYTDQQHNEAHIMFNAFGNELVNTVYAADLGSEVRVAWKPSAREYNGRWYGKNEAYDITVFENRKQTEPPQSEPLFNDRQPITPKEADTDYPF